MKLTKYIAYFALLYSLNQTVEAQKNNKDPYKELGINSINALVADQSYYTQAITRYNVAREVVSQFGRVIRVQMMDKDINEEYNLQNKSIIEAGDSITYLMEIEIEKFFYDNKERILDIIKHKESNSKFDPFRNVYGIRSLNDSTALLVDQRLTKEAEQIYNNLPVMDCVYEIPTDLKNLKSGFQFNQYAFDSRNNSALQAFGIANANYGKQTFFVIIDYLQYLDCSCGTLPKIRYAVGIRAQLRIQDTKLSTDLGEVPSLPKLAASVENNAKKVDISIRTIGITGIPARFSIPSNTSFDVETYHDYQNVIQFIKSLEDTTTLAAVKQEGIKFRPEVIPILDDYKISLEESFEPIYRTIDELEKKIRKMKYKKWFLGKKGGLLKSAQDGHKGFTFKYDQSRLLENSYYRRTELLEDQLDYIQDRRRQEFEASDLINSYSRFISLLTYLRGIKRVSAAN